MKARQTVAALVCAAMLLSTVPYVSAGDGATDSAGDGMNTQWEEVQTMISQYYGEWTAPTYPGAVNSRIPNTALLGNGDVGVSSAGDETSKRFHISKGDFWEYNNSPLLIGSVTIGTEATANTGNLAPSYSKVTASTEHESYTGAKAVDGKWRANAGYEGWSSAVGNPQWLMLEFKEPISFDRYVIRNDGAARPSEAAYNTKDCEVQVSENGKDWTTVSTVTGNSENVIDRTLDRVHTARYVRLYITKGTQETTADSVQYPRARIGAFELYDTRNENETEGNPTPDSGEEIPFHEKQDILHAEVVTKQKLAGVPMQVESWMSATNNLFVMEITSLSEATEAEVTVDLEGYVNGGRPTTAEAGGDFMTVTRSTVGARPADRESYTSKAVMTARLIGAEGSYTVQNDSTARLTFRLPAGEKVYIVTAVTGGGRTYDCRGKLWEGRVEPTEEAAALLKSVASKEDVETLHEAHLAWWRDYWMQSYIVLDTSSAEMEYLQKYYYAALYELGCGIREGHIAAGLYGIWHTNDNPSWHSDYHLNYNFISAYYGLATANRVSMLRPAVEALMDYVPRGIENAASIEQLRAVYSPFVDELIERGQVDPRKGIQDAILFPVAIGPYGMTLEHNAYHHETVNAPLSAYPLIEYYNFTRDETFMKDTLYVYLKYVLTFLEHWIVEEDGKYTLYAGYNEGSWAINPALELSAYKMCLAYGIQVSEALGVDADRRAVWQKIYDGLADQPTVSNYKGTGKTVLSLAEKEWQNQQWVPMATPVPGDGNCIPLEAVIPGEVFGYYSSDEELEILQNTVQVFSENGAWTQINNFPKLAPVAVNVRYDCNEIIQSLARAIRSQMQPNLMIDDGIHGIEKAGAIEAIQNMMLLSDKGVIKLFGNWPADKDGKFVRLRARGAFVLSAEYDGSAGEILEGVTLYSEAGGTATVASLWAEGMVIRDENGRRIEAVQGTAPNHEEEITYTFSTEAGKTYTLIKIGSYVEPETESEEETRTDEPHTVDVESGAEDKDGDGASGCRSAVMGGVASIPVAIMAAAVALKRPKEEGPDV